MTSRTRVFIAALVAATACTEASAPGPVLEAPASVSARALNIHVVRLEWTAGTGPIEGYRIERRANLTGPFSVISPAVPHSRSGALVTFLDANVEPETFYGYRVISLGELGQESGPSVIAGTRTPPLPGIDVETGSTVPVPEAADPDGYWVTVEGPNSAAAPLGINDRRRFAPLVPGTYSVTLSGVRPSCDVQDAPIKSVTVSDTGVQTVAGVGFRVVCRDPALGRIHGSVAVAGDSTDPDGFGVTAVGLRADTTLPDSQRVVHLETGLSGAGGTFDFNGLFPGAYEISLSDVAAHCSVGGAAVRQVTVAPLSDDSLHFAVTCQGSNGGTDRPYVWHNTWSPPSAAPGGKVTLEIALDLSAAAGERVSGVQAELRYDAAVLRYDSASPGALPNGFAPNSATAGSLFWLGATFTNPPGGAVLLARFHFTVTGSAGTAAASRTTITEVLAADAETRIDSLIKVREDTLPVTAPGANQPPNARANGPYGGAAGAAITFTAAGSSDPDGTITSYSWAFGDGARASGATPAHSYAAAGTYTATLTVTDNLGATGTDEATVTVTMPGGSTPFTLRGTFGALNPVDSVVVLTLTLDLTSDIPETPGPEALATFVMDSLKWDPTVLRYHAFNWGPGGAGGTQVFAPQGKIIITSASTPLPATANSGVIELARIRFKSIASARSTTTITAVGPLISTAATGSYNYQPRTAVVEATFTAP